ncbi:MAG: glycerophosphodiester phosphodiesterase family protein [Bacteriovoracaceae bacterium]
MNYFLLFLATSAFAGSFDWEGHRGSRGLMPENTIESMREGLRWPITTLELDVVISKDKKVVVSHEPWMNPVICKHPEGKTYKEKEINLYKMNYSEILKYDCGSLPYARFPDQKKMSVGKPLLSALLMEIEEQLNHEKRTIQYNIEIKSDLDQEKGNFQPKVPEFTDLAVAAIKDFLPEDRFILQSFDARVLKYLHEKYPKITLSWLTEDKQNPDEVKKQLGFLPQIFSPDYQKLSYEDVPLFHAENVRIVPWTVNNADDMKKLQAIGVDGIITDYPNLIPQVIAKVCPPGANLYEGECVKIPTHALPSQQNPGWVCKEGFVQRRFHCDRIKVPTHAVLSADGKGWECKENYERYRGTCRKK